MELEITTHFLEIQANGENSYYDKAIFGLHESLALEAQTLDEEFYLGLGTYTRKNEDISVELIDILAYVASKRSI